MGRLRTLGEQEEILVWAEKLRPQAPPNNIISSISSIKQHYYEELQKYFSLAALSRSQTAPYKLTNRASAQLFRVRVLLEEALNVAVKEYMVFHGGAESVFFTGNFFGRSRKQGVSIRMPLTTCMPTSVCSYKCYAHDVLDATPLALYRGVVNGIVAESYEDGSDNQRQTILRLLEPQAKKAIKESKTEIENLPREFSRSPRIRFGHVGDIAAYPDFANALARQINRLSIGQVICSVYTRHKRARELDPDLLIINFTIDATSERHKEWVPDSARIVYAAFNGHLNEEAEINFLEHHRWQHYEPIGSGFVCPATAHDTKVRTCDACLCCRCFTPTASKKDIGTEHTEI